MYTINKEAAVERLQNMKMFLQCEIKVATNKVDEAFHENALVYFYFPPKPSVFSSTTKRVERLLEQKKAREAINKAVEALRNKWIVKKKMSNIQEAIKEIDCEGVIGVDWPTLYNSLEPNYEDAVTEIDNKHTNWLNPVSVEIKRHDL